MKGLLTLLCCICIASAASGQIIINEVVYDSEGTDVDTWLELLGPGDTALDGYRLIGINGNGGAEYNEILLDGLMIPADGYFLITEDPARPDSDYSTALVDFQNGSDSIQLQFNEQGVWVVVDAVGYGAFGGGEVFAGEGTPAPDQVPPYSLARCPDGNDTDDNGADFILDDLPTPGSMNVTDCTPILGACCFIDGSCLELTEADCGIAGGTYQGDGTVCDPNPCQAQQPTDYTACELAENDPTTGRPLHEGEWVRVTGVALMESWVWAGYRTEFTIADENGCCVNVFWNNNTDPLVVRGDLVEVVGTLGFFNGKTQVTTPDISIVVLSQGNPIPDPTPITTFEMSVNGEAYESCLVKFTCVTIVDGTWPPEGQDANLVVDDGSGPTVLRIDQDTDIDGSPAPTQPFSAVGVAGQYDNSEPYFDGYQSIMRDLGDVLQEDCGPITGACCFADGSCQVLYEDECTTAGGESWIAGQICDPNPCIPTEPTDYTLCEVAENDPATGRPLHEGEWVRVSGISLMESYVWASYRTEFSITDDSGCCVHVYNGSAIDPPILRGDMVEVIGTLGFYNGKTQITTPDLTITVLSQGNPIPDPTVVLTGDLAADGESYEGCLIKLECVTITGGDPWPPEGSSANVEVNDGSGPTTLRVDSDTNIDGSPAPEGEFSAVGIAGQYDNSSPYFEGYQCVMRDLDDVLYDDCLPPTGACCFEDGTCQVLFEAECTQVGGTQWIEGEVCEPNPCPQPPPLGACCFEDGTCQYIEQALCDELGGLLWIEGEDCEPDPCPPVAVEESSWGRIKASYK